ncbi:hypothetical protein ACWEGV_00710, partial [Streptomyces sp. NPDC004976]
MCRPCLQASRIEQDAAWLSDAQHTPPRHLQLLLVFYGITPSVAQPLRKYALRKRAEGSDGRDRLRWLERQRALLGPERDDPAVCPPTVPGQLTLFTPRRHLPLKIVPRILHRPLRGYDDLLPITAAYAAEHGYSKPWLRQLQQMVRLVLAVRDADGCDLVPEETIDDLQYYQVPVTECLRRADMLQPRQRPKAPRPKPPQPAPRASSRRTPPAVRSVRPPRPPRVDSCPDC